VHLLFCCFLASCTLCSDAVVVQVTIMPWFVLTVTYLGCSRCGCSGRNHALVRADCNVPWLFITDSRCISASLGLLIGTYSSCLWVIMRYI
jgi:hypothetical protein